MRRTSICVAGVLSLFCAIAVAQEAPSSGDVPGEVRRGVPTGGTREERAKRAYELAIRKIEPNLVGDPARLSQYLEFFKLEFVDDPRAFAFDVTASRDAASGAVSLGGFVEFDEHRKALGEFLGHLGFNDVKNDVKLLPDPALGEKQFAIVGDQPVYIYDRITTPRETYTEALPGDAIFVLKEADDGMLLCHVADGYVGYLDAARVKRVSGEEFDSYAKSRTFAPGRDERVEAVIAAAHKFMGTKYVWGGKTGSGIDCSGLVHESYRAAGVRMPRDADQQSLVGTLSGTRWHRSSIGRGDTLFFLTRRGTVGHTAIYLGDDKFIEAADGGVKISDLKDLSKKSNKTRGDILCFAKRVLE